MRLLFICALAALLLRAETWVLVSHPKMRNEGVSASQLRAIYLGQKKFVGGVRVLPLHLPNSSPLRRQFESEILQMSRSSLRQWWVRRHYLGERPPKVMGSARSVLAYVQAVEGAVGYVPEALADDANVSILYPAKALP